MRGILLIILAITTITATSFLNNQAQASAAKISKKKTVVIIFDDSEPSKDGVYQNPRGEQLKENGQFAANARRSLRLSNEMNAPIPEDEALDLFDVKPTSSHN